MRAYRFVFRPLLDRLTLTFAILARSAAQTFPAPKELRTRRWLVFLFVATVLVGLGFAVFHGVRELSDLHRADYLFLVRSAALTLLRVSAALLLGALWTFPVGGSIRPHPPPALVAHALSQIAAALPPPP